LWKLTWESDLVAVADWRRFLQLYAYDIMKSKNESRLIEEFGVPGWNAIYCFGEMEGLDLDSDKLSFNIFITAL
jgi:hypothetical protein